MGRGNTVVKQRRLRELVMDKGQLPTVLEITKGQVFWEEFMPEGRGCCQIS